MKKEWLVKTLACGIIVLFIIVSFQPVLAKDTISFEKKSDIKELLETVIDIANNKEIQRIFLKSQINRGLFTKADIKFSLTKNQLRLMFLIKLFLSKSISKSMMQSLASKYQLDNQETQKEISDVVKNAFKLNSEIVRAQNSECNCEKKNLLDWWSFPIICGIALVMFLIGSIFQFGYWIYGIALFWYISLPFMKIASIALKLECPWLRYGWP